MTDVTRRVAVPGLFLYPLLTVFLDYCTNSFAMSTDDLFTLGDGVVDANLHFGCGNATEDLFDVRRVSSINSRLWCGNRRTTAATTNTKNIYVGSF